MKIINFKHNRRYISFIQVHIVMQYPVQINHPFTDPES